MDSVLHIPDEMKKAYAEFVKNYIINFEKEGKEYSRLPSNIKAMKKLIKAAESIMGEPFIQYCDPILVSTNITLYARALERMLFVEEVLNELYGEVYDRVFRYNVDQMNSINSMIKEFGELQEDVPGFRYKGSINYVQKIELYLGEKKTNGSVKAKVICYAKKSFMLEDTSFIDHDCIVNHIHTILAQKLNRIKHPNPRPIEKRGPIPLEARLWRYNYYMRLVAGIIPKRRPCDADSDASGTAIELWYNFGEEWPEECQGEWKPFKTKDVSAWKRQSLMYSQGKWYQLAFRNGLYEMEEIKDVFDPCDGHMGHPTEEQIKIMNDTPLPPPPSVRACGYEVKMDAKTKERWISKCPDWMKDWAVMMIKPKDGSWTK